MRTRIRLDTLSDVNSFVAVTTRINEDIALEDNAGHRVNAKSLLGSIYTLEWEQIFVTCDKDITAYIIPWII